MVNELVYTVFNRTPAAKSNLAVKPLAFRYQSILARSLVRLVRDNGHFLSVAKRMKHKAPTLYAMLVHTCLQEPDAVSSVDPSFGYKLGEFFLQGSKRKVATNIPVLLSIVTYLYVEERPHVLCATDATTAKEHFAQIVQNAKHGERQTMELDMEDPPEPSETCGHDHVDDGKGNLLDLYCPLREYILTRPFKRSKKKDRKLGGEYLPGEIYIASDSKDYKFGKTVNRDWTQDVVSVGFYKCRPVPFEHALHAIATGGFITPQEQKAFHDKHGEVDFDDPATEQFLRGEGETGRRILAVNHLWVHIEKESNFFKDDGLEADEAHPCFLGSCYEITQGFYDWEVNMDDPGLNLNKKKRKRLQFESTLHKMLYVAHWLV